MIIYKYLKRCDLVDFMDTGTLRLGTLEGYRKIESRKIRDPLEGKTVFSIGPVEKEFKLSMTQANALSNDHSILPEITFGQGAYFSSELIVPNAFVFSTSTELNPGYWLDYGYDTYYAILDPREFMSRVLKSVAKQTGFVFAMGKPVNYVPSKFVAVTNENKDEVLRTEGLEDWPSKVHSHSDNLKRVHVEDYFTKPVGFKSEKEYRMIIVPKNTADIRPLFLDCPAVLDICEIPR